MKVYFCATTSMAEQLNAYALALEARGHTITSLWHRMEHSKVLELSDPTIEYRALMDLDDLVHADTVVAFTGSETNHGGRHFELGYAKAWGKRIYLIGEIENIFHTLVHKQFPDWATFLEWVERHP